MAGLLTFARDEMVHLDPGSYRWVSIKQFSMCDADATDRQALTALLDQHEYHDHYAGQPISEQDHHSLHGPYMLAAITPDLFRGITAEAARTTLLSWADDPVPASRDAQLRLADRVFPILDRGELYELPALGASAEHDWAGVVGTGGFYEFVSVDRSNLTVVLVVASDD